MGKILMKGKIFGFEEYRDYILEDYFGDDSPFRLLTCENTPVSFIVVNPFVFVDDYNVDVGNYIFEQIGLCNEKHNDAVVLCIVRCEENNMFINLRSPLIINPGDGSFSQVITLNEEYGTAVPFPVNQTL